MTIDYEELSQVKMVDFSIVFVYVYQGVVCRVWI